MAAATASFMAMECGGRALIRRREELSGSAMACRRMKIGAHAALTVHPGKDRLGSTDDQGRISVGADRLRLLDAGNSIRRTKVGQKTTRSNRKELPPVSHEKLDEWMKESVAEIVRNIGEAPFLIHIFSNRGSEEDSSPSTSSSVRLEREPAVVGNWPAIRQRWYDGSSPVPDGVILVEELKGEEEEESEEEEVRAHQNLAESSSRTWGVLVQGRGAECSVCYILNTCRVRSSVGASTHFCLARAKCFGDTAEAQLRKSWLLRSQQ